MASGLVWGINSDVDVIWITTPASAVVALFSQCFIVFYYRSRNPQSPLVTSPTLLCCFGTVFQVIFISHTTIIPHILLHFGNCSVAWIITEHGLDMDVLATCACLPWISPGVCQPVPSRRCPQGWPGWHPGVPTAIYTIHTNHKGWIPPNPAQFPGAAVPFLPLILLSPLNPTLCTLCQLKAQSVAVPPFPLPHHSNFRHIGFETHALCCESFLI